MKRVFIFLVLAVLLVPSISAYILGVHQGVRVDILEKGNSTPVNKIEELLGENFDDLDYPFDIQQDSTVFLSLYIDSSSYIAVNLTYGGDKEVDDFFMWVTLPRFFSRKANQTIVRPNQAADVYPFEEGNLYYLIHFKNPASNEFYAEFWVDRYVSELIYDDIDASFFAVFKEKNETIITTLPSVNIIAPEIPSAVKERESIFLDFNASERIALWITNRGVINNWGHLNVSFEEDGLYDMNVTAWSEAGVSDSYFFTLFVKDVPTLYEWFIYNLDEIIIGLFVISGAWLLFSLLSFIASFKKIMHSGCYLLEGERKRAFYLYKHHTNLGMPGLCITDLKPKKLKRKYHIREDVFLISRQRKSNSIAPNRLEEIQDRILNFIENNKGNVVLLDGFHVLKSHNSFRSVLQMVQNIKDRVSLENTRFMVLVDPKKLSKQELANLRTELEDIMLKTVRTAHIFKQESAVY